MSDVKQLTLNQEFCFYTGVVMNNWFALKILANNSSDSLHCMNQKIKGLFDLLISSTQLIISNRCHWTDPIEALEDYFDFHFNTIIEDNSCEEVLNELVNYYNLLLDNKREVLASAIAHLSEKKDIFTREEYNPDKIVRVIEQTMLPEGLSTENHLGETLSQPSVLPDEIKLLTNSRMDTNMSSEIRSGIASQNISQPNCENEWEIVHSRRKKPN